MSRTSGMCRSRRRSTVMRTVLCLTLSCLLGTHVRTGYAGYWAGSIVSSNCFEVIATFGYDSQIAAEDPNLEFTIVYPKQYDESLSLIAYFDNYEDTTDFSFASDSNELTCQQRLEYARESGYTTLLDHIGIDYEKDNSTEVGGMPAYAVTTSVRVVQSYKRFWTLALVNTVKNTRGLSDLVYVDGPLTAIAFQVATKNTGTPFELAGSNEAAGIFVAIAAFVLQLILTLVATWIMVQLALVRNLHHIYTCFFVGVVLDLVSTVLSLTNFAYYAAPDINRYHVSGSADNQLQFQISFASKFFHVVANALLLLTVSFLAKGWNIVRYKITADGRVKLVIFFAAYLSVNVLAIAYDTFSSDAMSTVGQIYTQYLTAMVATQIVFNIFALVWLSRIAALTIGGFKKKKALLTKLAVCNGSWLFLHIVSPFVGAALSRYQRDAYLAIAPYAPNMALELLYIVLFFPGGEIRKLFKFKDKQTPKSAFDAGPKAFKDETDSNDMRPVDEVYMLWMKKHASGNFTPVDLLLGKISHVVMRIKLKRDAMVARLCMFQQLLASQIPDLKEVVSPQPDDAKFDGFDSTRSLQISGISVGLNASGSTSVEQKEDRDVAAEVSAAIRAAEHEEHPAMAEARARESRPGSQAEARTEPEEEDGVAPATLDEVLEASPQLQDTGSGNQQTRAGSGDDDEVLVRKEKKKKKKKKRRRKQQLASDDDSGPATTDTRNSDPSAEESKEDTSVPESDGNTGTSDLGEPQTERRRRSSRPHRKDRSRSRSRSRSRTRNSTRSHKLVDEDEEDKGVAVDAAAKAAKAKAILARSKERLNAKASGDDEPQAQSSRRERRRSRSRSRGAKREKKSKRQQKRMLADDDDDED